MKCQQNLSVYFITKQMITKEKEAVRNLAEMQDDDYDDFKFQPYSSAAFIKKQKIVRSKQRPQTVTAKRNTTPSLNTSARQQNKRQQLKKQLRILQQSNYEQKPKANRKIITSQSLFCMIPLTSKYNGFPSHGVKKQSGDKFMSPKNIIKTIGTKENITPYACINPEEQIRADIMKKFKLRENAREAQKFAKINNFLKMTKSPTARSKPAPIMFNLNDAKYKRTLTNLLA